jgi:acyl-CoA reductase-like NAD-dependent aldehyde dehydrogenase
VFPEVPVSPAIKKDMVDRLQPEAAGAVGAVNPWDFPAVEIGVQAYLAGS